MNIRAAHTGAALARCTFRANLTRSLWASSDWMIVPRLDHTSNVLTSSRRQTVESCHNPPRPYEPPGPLSRFHAQVDVYLFLPILGSRQCQNALAGVNRRTL